jgi:hypothetical protein
MKPDKRQEDLIVRAGMLIKEAFPKQNLQFNFNLSQKHETVNYNIEGTWKISGIKSPKKQPSVAELVDV